MATLYKEVHVTVPWTHNQMNSMLKVHVLELRIRELEDELHQATGKQLFCLANAKTILSYTGIPDYATLITEGGCRCNEDLERIRL